jgi:V/A-type H+/Na+-transporting ATPase subunit K
MRKSTLLGSALLLTPSLAFAAEGVTTAATSSNWALALAFVGAALATALPCYGSAMGVSLVASSGAGLLTEKPNLAGKVITLTVLPGSQGLYGMVISLLFLFSFGLPLINGTVTLSVADGLSLFACFIPVAITCATSAPYQGKVCAAGMHMLAKDEANTGKVITLAALVETYALLGFLISFFMLNALKTSILS